MARLTRLAIAGQLHHVALRGHSGMAIFHDDEDRRAFLETLNQAVREHSLALHAYALLEAEVHALVTPPTAEALSRAVQSLGRRYVARFNRRHGRTGTLWDGRFRSSVLEPATWLFPATAYIETLPAVQHLVAHPADWPWSSAAARLGRCRDTLLNDHADYWRAGNTPFDRERAHADLLLRGVEPVEAAAIEAALRRGLVLGTPPFVETLQRQARRPLLPRNRGRPRTKLMRPH